MWRKISIPVPDVIKYTKFECRSFFAGTYAPRCGGVYRRLAFARATAIQLQAEGVIDMQELLSYLKGGKWAALFTQPTTNGCIQAFRYIFVGGIAFVVDWGILWIATSLHLHYLLATGIAFVGGLVVNYFLSKAFVFKAEQANVGKAAEFFVYAAIGAVGLLITEGLMYLAVDLLHIWVMMAKIVIAAIVLVWNYALRKVLLYRKKSVQPAAPRSRIG